MIQFPGLPPGQRPTSQTFVITPADVLDQQFDDFQQGIRIDNLSYVWLYVEPLRRYVPPLRIGWTASIKPASRNIRVTPLPSPTGQAPLGTGGHINVETTTYLVAESVGSDTSYMPEWGSPTDNDTPWVPESPEPSEIELHITTGASTVVNDIETYNVEIETSGTANTTTTHDVSFDAGTDTSIRLRIMQMKYIALGGNPPLAWVEVHSAQDGTNPFAYLGVSAAMPTDWIIIPDSGVLLPYDGTIPGISLFLRARSDKTNVNLRLLFGYHPVAS